MRFFVVSCALFLFSGFTVCAGERAPEEYLDICLSAGSREEVRNRLLADDGWTPVQISEESASYAWGDIAYWTPEALLLVANFALNDVRSGSTKSSIEIDLEFFTKQLSFERQLIPIYPIEKFEFYFNEDQSSVIAVQIDVYEPRKFPRTVLANCYYAKFGEIAWKNIFENHSMAGEVYEGEPSRAIFHRIKPDANGDGIVGAMLFAREDFLREILGISKGDLFVFQVRN